MILSLLVIPAVHVTLIGALSGLVGAFAYLDRRIFFAESVTHGTFPGAVLGVVVAAALGYGHSGMSAALYVGAFLGTLPLVALGDAALGMFPALRLTEAEAGAFAHGQAPRRPREEIAQWAARAEPPASREETATVLAATDPCGAVLGLLRVDGTRLRTVLVF